ncbi:MAG TPA: pyruvate ferredoxin oxidoreductase [Dehalococcoidales bacterium]|nr:pyruvate ferredoxin oxidoreductase [Dehalococcoidales bacterium]
MVKQMRKFETRVITGNASAAYAVRLCRPEIVALYPITPQSEVVEQLTRFKADGELAAEMIEVEGENSAMNAVTAASVAGARVFTATASYGLAFMYDAMMQTSGYRAPVVMVNVNREIPGIHGVATSQQDLISVRDIGWIQLIVEDDQEIVDTVIQSYRLAEDYDIQLPVQLNYDGYYVSFLAEGVKIPIQADVDEFLSVLKTQPERMTLKPGVSFGAGSHGMLVPYTEMRYRHMQAMERAKAKFDQIDKEFGDFFGRYHGGQIEEYRCKDAEIVLVATGSAAGTAKTVIDAMREKGVKVGLVKIRMYRPFPRERLVSILQGKKAVGVLDRSVAFGWNSGPILVEIRSLTPQVGNIPMLSFIDGIANLDITAANIERMIKDILAASKGQPYEETTWISLEEQV